MEFTIKEGIGRTLRQEELVALKNWLKEGYTQICIKDEAKQLVADMERLQLDEKREEPHPKVMRSDPAKETDSSDLTGLDSEIDDPAA